MRQMYVIPMPKFKPVIADLSEQEDGTWRISRINVPEKYRTLGHGAKILDMILIDADKEGVTLTLEPVATGRPGVGLSQAQLVKWYERHGFKWHESKRFMYRWPRQ